MNENRVTRLTVVILAGGDGQWLDPLTLYADGVSTPKQYSSIYGSPSLLQLSLRRALRLVPQEQIAVVVSDTHRRWWEPELSAFPRLKLIVQPSDCGSAPGVLLPLLVMAKFDPEARVLCMPADQHVEQEGVLAESIRQAMAPEVLGRDQLTLLGISPDAADSSFGYLILAPDAGDGSRLVHRFVQRPGAELADQRLRAGFVWNSGMFAGRIASILSLCRGPASDLLRALRTAAQCWRDSQVPSALLVSLYARNPVLDFWRDVVPMHRTGLQCVPVPPCGWCEVRTPARLATIFAAPGSPNHRLAGPSSPASYGSLMPEFTAAPAANAARFALEALLE